MEQMTSIAPTTSSPPMSSPCAPIDSDSDTPQPPSSSSVESAIISVCTSLTRIRSTDPSPASPDSSDPSNTAEDLLDP
jgi:hypothetical protein